MALLKLQGLGKTFGGITAVDKVDMEVEQDCIHAVIGPNGAGKTTLFNMVSGLIRPSRGWIDFGGDHIEGLRPDKIAKKGISRTFQQIRLFKELTLLENVMIGRHCRTRSGMIRSLSWVLAGIGKEERETRSICWEILEFVGLAGKIDNKAGSLPYGSQRKLEIARALASDPVLLLLDEPAAGMDIAETIQLGATVRAIRDKGITVLLIEHDMRLVMDISDVVTVLNFGEKIAEGPPHEVQSSAIVIEAYLGT